MLSSVSNVSFKQQCGLYDRPNFDAPQANARPMSANPQEEPKKNSHKFLKTVAGLAATAAVAVGLLAVGGKKGWFKPDVVKKILPDKLLKWDKVASLKEPVAKGLNALNNCGRDVAAWGLKTGRNINNFVSGLFSRAPKPAEPASATPPTPPTLTDLGGNVTVGPTIKLD